MESFWDDCSAFLAQTQRHFNTNDVFLADRLATRGHDYLHALSVIRSRVCGLHADTASDQNLIQQMTRDFSTVVQELDDSIQHFEAISASSHGAEQNFLRTHVVETNRTGTPGRPAYVIPLAQIEAMSDIGLNYEQMSRILGVSSRTLRRHRQQHGMPVGTTNYTDMSNEALDALITSILKVSSLVLSFIPDQFTTFAGDNGCRCLNDERCFVGTWYTCAARACS